MVTVSKKSGGAVNTLIPSSVSVGNKFEFWVPKVASKPTLPAAAQKPSPASTVTATVPIASSVTKASKSSVSTPAAFIKSAFKSTAKSPFGTKGAFGASGDGHQAISKLHLVRAALELGYGPHKNWTTAFVLSKSSGRELASYLLLRLQSIMTCLELLPNQAWAPRPFYEQIEASEKVSISFMLGSMFSYLAARMWLEAAGDKLELFLHVGLYTKATFMPDPAIANDDWPSRDVTLAEREDPAYTPTTRYWVEEAEVLARIARVPSRVANAWLAWREAITHAEEAAGAETQIALADSRAALTLALASWVAGALFLRESEQAARIEASTPTSAPRMQKQTSNLFGDPEPQVSGTDKSAHPWSNQVAANSTNVVERLMTTRYPVLADALKGAGTAGKKALPAFTKWALQADSAQGLGLSDDELDALQTLQASAATSHSAANSGATSAYTTVARAQFDLNFSWLNVWMDRRSPRWLMGWRDITNATNERTVIASVFGRAGVGNNLPLMLFGLGQSTAECAALVGNLDSMVLDFVARNKVGGVHLNFIIIKQLPVLPPSRYTESDLAYIVPRVLELTYTAQDMQPWADDLAAFDPRPADQRQTPFPWNPERRAQLRAELDANYARLYGLTRDELRYILDPAEVMDPDYPSETFRVLQKNEMKAYGEYRTQRLVLEAWDKFATNKSERD